MILIFLLFSALLFGAYYFLKYHSFLDSMERSPTSSELFGYSFENDVTGGKNARAIKYLAIFIATFSVIAIPFSSSPYEFLRKKDNLSDLIQIFILGVLVFNLMARYALFREIYDQRNKYTMPLLRIIDLTIKAKWFVKANDVVGWILNITSILIIASLTGLIYLAFK